MSNKWRHRKQIGHTIDANILADFNAAAEKYSINKSRLIEQLLRNWLLQISDEDKKYKLRVSDDGKLMVE